MENSYDELLETYRRHGSTENGWFACKETIDFECQQFLSNIIHAIHEPPNLEENETLYSEPPKTAIVRLLWINGEPAGFYILRPKGFQEEGSFLEMHTMDGVFIRQQFRRQGWGIAMLNNIVQNYPNHDIGFSQPVSQSMWSLLKKYLSQNPQLKTKFWAVEGCAEEGNRFNVWFSLAAKNINKK